MGVGAVVVVGVLEAEAVGVPVGEGVGVAGGVALLEREALPVLEGEAPLVSEAVGETLMVELAESVALGVKGAVPVPLGVGEGVPMGEGVGGGVPLLDSELLPLLEGVAPIVSEAVGDADTQSRAPESVRVPAKRAARPRGGGPGSKGLSVRAASPLGWLGGAAAPPHPQALPVAM